MNTYKASNIPYKTMIWFLEHNGLKHITTVGGHAKYTRNDLLRPVTIQTHYCPVPEFIVLQILKALGYDKKSFHLYLKKHY